MHNLFFSYESIFLKYNMNWSIVLLCILFMFILWRVEREGLISKPQGLELDARAREIIGAKEDFSNTTLDNARRKLPWLDNVTYEDLRGLARSGRFDHENIKTIFH